jgi:CheY-like chemotaxis protein
MRLLLVEDETAIRTALARGLAHEGTEVFPAASLQEARELAHKHLPEAMLSDLKLPDGSGLDLAGELGLPFVLMSGFASYDDAVQAMRMGCVDFFTKPVPIKDLRRALDRLSARIRVDNLQVIEPGGTLRLVRSAALGMVVQPFSAQAWSWSSREEAERLFASVLPGTDLAVRQVVAELMQAAAAGRLVTNVGPDWLVAWLEAEVDWQTVQAERRQVIEDLGERCIWRKDGALVECSHG